jgi:hypothetical protein
VFNTARSLGFDAVLETNALGLSVDVAEAAQALAIEVEGPYHFARNRPDLSLGNALWKRRLLEAGGWAVVNLNVARWHELRSPLERRRHLAAEVGAAQAQAAARRRAGSAGGAAADALDEALAAVVEAAVAAAMAAEQAGSPPLKPCKAAA